MQLTLIQKMDKSSDDKRKTTDNRRQWRIQGPLTDNTLKMSDVAKDRGE